MKNIVCLLLFLFGAALISNAQQGSRKDRIEALKARYITDKLSLTPEEAKYFWPVYDKYQDELEVLRKGMKEKIRAQESIEKMNDKEASKLLDEIVTMRVAEAELLKKYTEEFKKVLPVKKVVLLFKAEQEFKRELLHKLSDKKQ